MFAGSNNDEKLRMIEWFLEQYLLPTWTPKGSEELRNVIGDLQNETRSLWEDGLKDARLDRHTAQQLRTVSAGVLQRYHETCNEKLLDMFSLSGSALH